ncbi:MAG: histidine phosphatase family protein [Opitutales bacterium]
MSSTKTTIYAVRHGETEWNILGKQQGHLNSPLNARGKLQAAKLAEGLKGRGIQFIYSSDLGRAQETATIVANELRLPVTFSEKLRERNLGILQGFTQKEFQMEHPEIFQKFKSTDPNYQIPEGESKRELYKRCVSATEEIIAKHPGETILIVCHSGVVRSFFHRATQLPLETPRKFSLLNGAINQFAFIQDWSLLTWGEVAHLQGTSTIDDF